MMMCRRRYRVWWYLCGCWYPSAGVACVFVCLLLHHPSPYRHPRRHCKTDWLGWQPSNIHLLLLDQASLGVFSRLLDMDGWMEPPAACLVVYAIIIIIVIIEFQFSSSLFGLAPPPTTTPIKSATTSRGGDKEGCSACTYTSCAWLKLRCCWLCDAMRCTLAID